MAIKLKIDEQCSRCGGHAAVLRGEFVCGAEGCTCPAPPGPPDPPLHLHVSQVTLMRGDFTTDELRVQLDAERLALVDVKQRLGRAEQKLRDVAKITA